MRYLIWLLLPLVSACATLSNRSAPDLPPLVLEAASPTETPFDVRPMVKNQRQVFGVLQRESRPLVARGLVGKTLIWFHIDETGRPLEIAIAESSGERAVDEAALDVAKVMRFTPAENRGVRTAVWVKMPITFQSR